MGNASVVDQDINAAHLLDNLSNSLLDLGLVSDVGRQAQMALAEGGSGITGCCGIQIEDDNPGALLREGGCGCAANAPGGSGTGDDCDFALKKHGGFSLLFLWSRSAINRCLSLSSTAVLSNGVKVFRC